MEEEDGIAGTQRHIHIQTAKGHMPSEMRLPVPALPGRGVRGGVEAGVDASLARADEDGRVKVAGYAVRLRPLAQTP